MSVKTRTSFVILLLVLWVRQLPAQDIHLVQPVSLLALGDSYTIGQSVNAAGRWPDQLMAELARRGYGTAGLRIIAQTGWRTDNLQLAVNQQLPLNGYNLVSLLIGVNNQFQGGSIQTYSTEFEKLLQQAIQLAGGNLGQVFVLSIPDYAYTPYGSGTAAISKAIDVFNAENKRITDNYRVNYIEITPISRRGLAEPALVASDGLHPSGLMYGLWVQEIVKHIETDVGINETPASDGNSFVYLTGRKLQFSSDFPDAEYQVFSAAGKLLLHGSANAPGHHEISLQRFAPGMYFFRLQVGGRRVITRKVLLR